MPGPLLIFYDADCSLCQHAKARLERIDRSNQLRFVPLQDPVVAEKLPDVPAYQLRQTMHVLRPDGQYFAGAAAFREVGQVISPASPAGLGLRLFAGLTRVPGVLDVAEWVYRKVAENRYKFRFNPTECTVCDIRGPHRH